MKKQVTAAIIEKKGKYLIARRKSGGSQGGKWEFPGGKVEPGESLEQGLARELFEEFEIQVTIKEFLCSHSFKNGEQAYELMAFRVEHDSGKFVLHEHTAIQWAETSEFKNYDFAESDWAIIKKLFS